MLQSTFMSNFKPIPKFKDTLVQSCEGNFVQTVYNNKVQHYDWKFPSYIKDITHNYNPGIYGFTASSKVREIYYKTFLEYSKKNIDFVKGIESPIKKMLYKKEMQDVYLFLEEGLLWYLCSRLKVSPVEMIPNKYDEKLKPWGVFKKGKYREVDWTITFRICYMNWRKEKYVHLMNYNHLIANWKTSFLPQEVLLEVYYENKELVERLLKNDLWSA